MKPINDHLEELNELKRRRTSSMSSNSSTGSFYLGRDQLTYVDFMLFELSYRIQFLTDGFLFLQNSAIQQHHSRVMILPAVLNYICVDEGFKMRRFNHPSATINDSGISLIEEWKQQSNSF